MAGSLRQRGPNSWELRVYDGTYPDTARMRYVTRTVRGSRAEAAAELAVLAALVEHPRRRALDTTMGELFDHWYMAASPGWSPNTARQTRSVIRAHLYPRFGHLPVGKLTTADIDAFYAELRARGGRDGRPVVGRDRATRPRCPAPRPGAGGAVGVGVDQPSGEREPTER